MRAVVVALLHERQVRSTALAGMLYDLHGLPPEGDGAQVEGDRDAVGRLLAAFSDA